jgi:phosphatidylserine decarboxylase
MTIHREGYPTILITALLLAAINFGVYTWLCQCCCSVTYALLFISILLFLFIVSFFRIPNRTLTYGADKITAPCDGKVVVIEEVMDEEYFKERRLQISIFMSPANVHVNRNPIDGEVVYSQYHKGKYLVAWNPKSSTENERHSVVIKTGNNKEVLVKQIAGALAKRIVNYLKTGQQVKQNEELGFIKFGSRVDLLLPIGTEIQVKMNEVVKGGVSVIAKI